MEPVPHPRTPPSPLPGASGRERCVGRCHVSPYRLIVLPFIHSFVLRSHIRPTIRGLGHTAANPYPYPYHYHIQLSAYSAPPIPRQAPYHPFVRSSSISDLALSPYYHLYALVFSLAVTTAFRISTLLSYHPPSFCHEAKVVLPCIYPNL